MAETGAGASLWRGYQEHAGQPEGHGGVEEPRLDRGDRDTGAEQPRAQALEIGVESRLRRAVDVILEAPAIAGHRGERDDVPGALRLDRQSAVSGKRGSVCVDLGGRRLIKKHNT